MFLLIQINRLATNVGRILPKIALKWKDELVVNQNLEIYMTLKSPPVLINITNSKIHLYFAICNICNICNIT